MAKKLKNLKWDSVALEGFPISITSNLDGFVGLEECTDYGLDKEVKKKQKEKKTPKKRNNTSSDEKVVLNKKVRLSNGFVVENCSSVTPSVTNSVETKSNLKKNSSEEHVPPNKALATSKDIKSTKKLKPRHGENTKEIGPKLTPKDMLTWAEYKLPEPIITALAEQGFKVPTKIQQLSLPAAVHGRRDILGAAETGSGKTLAFGLPILNGIMKLKEKFEAGVDVYELQYKKSAAKKKQQNNEEVRKVKNNVSKKGNNNKNKPVPVKPKESSEDGYSSDNEHSDEEDEEESEETINKSETKTSDKRDSEDEYIEEIEVPIRKRKDSSDEGNDTDDSDDNYIHLSDILDHSAESSEEDEDEVNSSINDEKSSSENEEESESENEEESGSDNEDEKSNVENGGNDEKSEDNENSEEEDEELVGEDGIGCVKVVDNIEMPGHVVTRTGKPLYALILTPTRELALQVSRHLAAAAKYTGIRIATIVGGMAHVKQERVLRYGPEVVVATPGRLWELVNQGQPHLQQLDTVKFLAIDETDRMVERNHFEELHPLLERLNANPEQAAARQNFVFSATLTMVHELPSHMKGKKVTKRGKIINRKIAKMTPEQKVKRLVAMIGMTDPKVVDITQKNLGTAETLTESRITCSMEQKDVYLYYILKRHPGRTIVFCNSIGSVKRLAQLLTLLLCRPLPLHASMEQRQRLRNLERFGADPSGVLVATDVAARGLDIPDVDHVVHYQVPRTAENYVHRSGRTARANKEGLTILMMEPAEAYLYSKLCFTLNKTSEIPSFPVAPEALSPIRDLIKLAREVDALELKKRRVSQANGWREKAAREMDIILDEDDVPSKQADPGIEKALRAKKRDLNILMSRPLIPRGFSYKYPTLNDPNALKIVEENALQVMKKSLQSGEMKKEKRKSKNASLLKLEKMLKKK